MKKQYLLFLYFFAPASIVLAQQLPYRSSFAAADFVWNPAMTAVSEYMDWGLSYRQQWLGFDFAPSTATAHIQYPFVASNMSVGGWLMQDEAGPVGYSQVGGAYSYKVRVGREGMLSIGLSGSLSQHQFDGTKALAIDGGDPLLIGRRSSTTAPNAGVGFFYVSNTRMYELRDNGFFIGLGSHQLLTNEPTFKGMNREITLRRAVHANAVLGARFVSDYAFVEPSLWIDYAHNGLFYARANIFLEVEETFWAGASLATDYTIALQSGIVWSNSLLGDGSLRIGGMGTYSLGMLGYFQGLGFEVVVAYRYWR